MILFYFNCGFSLQMELLTSMNTAATIKLIGLFIISPQSLPQRNVVLNFNIYDIPSKPHQTVA